MTAEVSKAYLREATTGLVKEAEVWDSIVEQHLVDWETEWKPYRDMILQAHRAAGVSLLKWPQSRHWDWRNKYQCVQGMLSTPSFAVMCSGMTEGLMLLDLSLHRCQLPEQKGKHLVYVDFLEVAPWNWKTSIGHSPRYAGVGSLLLRAAIERSVEEGFKGRVGLHALPQANSWYGKLGMIDFGPDSSKSNLHYFEMPLDKIDSFIGKDG
jgi:hypothetical protein